MTTELAEFYSQAAIVQGEHQAELAHPKLKDAVVCADIECDTVYHREFESCPACGNATFYPLGKWIK